MTKISDSEDVKSFIDAVEYSNKCPISFRAVVAIPRGFTSTWVTLVLTQVYNIEGLSIMLPSGSRSQEQIIAHVAWNQSHRRCTRFLG